MTSVRAPDHYVRLEIDPDTFDAISGLFLDISFVAGEGTDELHGMLAIPEGGKEDVESGSCEAWLWLDEEIKIERDAKIDITLIGLSEIEITRHLGNPLALHSGVHLIGNIMM